MAPKKRAVRWPVTVWDFLDRFLVVCPSCSRQAIVRAAAKDRPPRLTCTNCGLSRVWDAGTPGVLFSRPASSWPKGQYALGDAADPYFHLPLWLQTPCAKNVLWAFNAHHLVFMRDYVSATDRRTV